MFSHHPWALFSHPSVNFFLFYLPDAANIYTAQYPHYLLRFCLLESMERAKSSVFSQNTNPKKCYELVRNIDYHEDAANQY